MTQQPQASPARGANWTVFVVMVLFIVVAFFFALEFITYSQSNPTRGEAVETLQPESYATQVAALLRVGAADPARGAELIVQNGCTSCHVNPSANLAPQFAGIGSRAGQSRPPLTAEAYLYESIVFPGAHIVEGYSNVMATSYGELSDEDLGAIIAYLLTLTDPEVETTPEATDVP